MVLISGPDLEKFIIDKLSSALLHDARQILPGIVTMADIMKPFAAGMLNNVNIE